MILRLLPLIGVILFFLGCSSSPPDLDRFRGTAFVIGTLIDGTGGPPVRDAIMLVAQGRIQEVGSRDAVEVPAGTEVVDLSGRYIIPGLINSHGHVGLFEGLKTGESVYTLENVEAQLSQYARYGVTSVLSLGGDQPLGFEIRNNQSTPDLRRARLFLAGRVFSPSGVDEVSDLVAEAERFRVDFIKIRVDDNLGTVPKMSQEVFKAIIESAHEKGLKVAAHLFYLEDAKALLEAGVDLLAHSVRDRQVDEEFLALMLEKGICLCPTLMREVSTFIYESEPEFFKDKFFADHADPEVVSELASPAYQDQVKVSPAAVRYREGLEVARQNLGLAVAKGIPIAMGTDTGLPGRFQGYFEHRELMLMSESGLTPAQVLRSATGGAATCLGLTDVGTLEEEKWADFIVLREDPLKDIRNTREIEAVWIAGNPIAP